MKRFLAALTAVLGLSLAASAAQADTTVSGMTLYDNNCQSCHGTPPNLRAKADRGVNNAAAIRSAITRNKGGMGYLSTLTDTELSSIASWMGEAVAAANAATNAETVFNWAENTYAQILQSREVTATYGTYKYRCYMTAGLCIGADTSNIYLYELANPTRGIYPIGTLNEYLSQAQSALAESYGY